SKCMRISPRPDGRLLDAYGRDAELLMDRRVPLALGIFVAAIAASGLIEWRYYPQRMWVFGLFFAAQVAVCIALIGCRRFLAHWQALTGAAVLAALTLGLLMIGYVTVVGSDSQLLCTGLVCLLAGTSLLLPWRF